MVFEEDFPSLKNQIYERDIGHPEHGNVCYTSSIKRHCLDKQKVIEAITLAEANLKIDKHGNKFSPEACFNLLKQMLFLED